MFGLFTTARKRQRQTRLTLTSGDHVAQEVEPPRDPDAQVELVCQAVRTLERVRDMVRRLPELPVGSRQDLLEQLASTSDSLRSLYFLDAIY